MSSKPHTDQVYREKRKPKGPIKFQLSLNDEQKKAKQVILDNAITVLKGKAGSGKTLVACQVALDLLLKNCLLYTSPSPRDRQKSRMPSSA